MKVPLLGIPGKAKTRSDWREARKSRQSCNKGKELINDPKTSWGKRDPKP